MSTLSQSSESFSFDNSFLSLSEPPLPSSPLSHITSLLSSLNEFEQSLNTSSISETHSIINILTSIISKCISLKSILQSNSKQPTRAFSMPTTSDHIEQSLTPKFSFTQKSQFIITASSPQLTSYCDVLSSECSTLSNSIRDDNYHMKDLLKTVKEMQDKGIITKQQKMFLKEKIIAKDVNFYYAIAKNDNCNSTVDLIREIRTYLKRFKIVG